MKRDELSKAGLLTASAALLLGAATFFAGCDDGNDFDDYADRAGDATRDAADEIDDALDDAGDALDDAADDLDDRDGIR